MRRCPAPRRRSRWHRRLVLLACALGWLGVAVPVAAEVIPEPPLVVEGAATDGQVHLTPATQTVDGGRVVWVLANGGEGTLTFDLAMHEVDTTTTDVAIGARTDLRLGRQTLTLAPGEVARVPLVLDDEDEPRALALVARTVDAEPETTVAGVALVGGGGTVDSQVVEADAGAGTFTVRLDAQGPTLVDLALRATAWPGLLRTQQVVDGVLVPAGGRDLEVELDGPLVGRVTLDVAVSGDPPARTSTAVWWWPTSTLVVVAVVLLLVTVAAVVWVRRRERGQPA